MMPGAYVYIKASQRNGTLYIGSTVELAKRAWEHRGGVVEGFTKRHSCHLLVWYEPYVDLSAARLRERRMKEWKREWKIKRIEAMNPPWRDLSDTLV